MEKAYDIEYLPIGKVKLNEGNPRFIKDDAFKRLVKSLANCPDLFKARPLICSDRTGKLVVLGGNMRLRAAKELKYKEVPVIVMRGLTEEQEQEITIKDNGSFGEWDFEILSNEWSHLPLAEWGVDVPEILIDQGADEPRDAEPQIDRAEELNKKWQVKMGDLWAIGEHRLLCGDSTKTEDVARVMDGEKATLVFTDPPYGVSIGKKNVMLNTFQKAGRCLTNLDMDDMPPAELGEMLLKAFRVCKTFMADDCSVFVCSPQKGGLEMMMMMMMQDAGLEVRHILNWIKNSPTFSMGRLDYDYQHEPILFTWNKTHKRNKAGQFQTTLWAVDKPRANKEHPTMKPIELPTCAILNHTDENDIAVDIFGGSGTTMVAAQNTNRKCRMIELSPNYCAVILDRMATAFPELKIERAE